jgi:hypothetical protein
MALYEEAFLNMAHMGGPLELALYNAACRYVIFIPLGSSLHTRSDALTQSGFSIGRDLPFARPEQRIIWEPDEFPRILAAFKEMEARLETGTATGHRPFAPAGPRPQAERGTPFFNRG